MMTRKKNQTTMFILKKKKIILSHFRLSSPSLKACSKYGREERMAEWGQPVVTSQCFDQVISVVRGVDELRLLNQWSKVGWVTAQHQFCPRWLLRLSETPIIIRNLFLWAANLSDNYKWSVTLDLCVQTITRMITISAFTTMRVTRFRLLWHTTESNQSHGTIFPWDLVS